MNDDLVPGMEPEPPIYELHEQPVVPPWVDKMSQVMATVLLVCIFLLAVAVMAKIGVELFT